MTEIFEDISEKRRKEIYSLFITISGMTDFQKATEIITLYRNTLSEHEQEFMDFVFNVFMEERGIHEDNND